MNGRKEEVEAVDEEEAREEVEAVDEEEAREEVEAVDEEEEGKLTKTRQGLHTYHDWKVAQGSWLRYLKCGLVCTLPNSWLVSSHFYPDGR